MNQVSLARLLMEAFEWHWIMPTLLTAVFIYFPSNNSSCHKFPYKTPPHIIYENHLSSVLLNACKALLAKFLQSWLCLTLKLWLVKIKKHTVPFWHILMEKFSYYFFFNVFYFFYIFKYHKIVFRWVKTSFLNELKRGTWIIHALFLFFHKSFELLY